VIDRRYAGPTHPSGSHLKMNGNSFSLKRAAANAVLPASIHRPQPSFALSQEIPAIRSSMSPVGFK